MADAKAKKIALLMLGRPSRPGADSAPMPDEGEDMPPDQSDDDDLIAAVGDLREALKGSDDEALAAAFRAAVSAAS